MLPGLGPLPACCNTVVGPLPPTMSDDGTYEVTLGGGPLGLSLSAVTTTNRGAIVEKVSAGGAAAMTGVIEKGHLLLRINGTDCTEVPFKGCMDLLKRVM